MQTSGIVRLKTLLPSLGMAVALTLPSAVSAAPGGFDLDLKELKKPAAAVSKPHPRRVEKRKTKTGSAHHKPTRKKTPATHPAAPRLVTLDGATACILARQFLEALTEPVPVEAALQGINMPSAIIAARNQGITVLLACGLHPAEAYTFKRLLKTDGVQLLNLTGDEPPTQVIQTVAREAGLSYRQVQGTPLSYELVDAQGGQVRLTVAGATTGGKQ